MVKGDTALDMRGRCSAGQKVCVLNKIPSGAMLVEMRGGNTTNMAAGKEKNAPQYHSEFFGLIVHVPQPLLFCSAPYQKP